MLLVIILILITIIIGLLNLKNQKKMANELDSLVAEVTETKSIMASAVTLIRGLKARLDEAIASGDPALLQALSNDLNSGSEDLAAAITANTPPTDDPETPTE